MKICFHYCLKSRYEFNNCKSGVVTFGETKSTHFKSMQDRKWFLGESSVDELYEYKNLGVTKNYVGSFSSNIEDNIEKTRKKAAKEKTTYKSKLENKKKNCCFQQILIFVEPVLWCM